MRLTISRADRDRLVALAAADPGREVCGLLLGASSVVKRLISCENVAADPARSFEIAPKAQLAALRAEREGGEAVIGYYHSHPNGVAAPSATDRLMAADDRIWLIIAGDRVTSWRLIDGEFASIPLVIAPDCA